MAQFISKEDHNQDDSNLFLQIEEKDLKDNLVAIQWIKQLLLSIDQTIEQSNRNDI